MGSIKICQSSGNKKQATGAILIWNKLEFRVNTTKWMKLDIHVIKEIMHSENVSQKPCLYPRIWLKNTQSK